jgi:hypothetical protein
MVACFVLLGPILGLNSSAFAEDPDLRLQAALEYRKAGVSISPTGATVKAVKSQGKGDPSVLNYTPNAVPGVGAGISFHGIGASYSQSLPQSQKEKSDLGESEIQHVEVHRHGSWYGTDLYREDYQGFFLHPSRQNDLRPFQDAIFMTGRSFPHYPDMHLTVVGGSALLVLPLGSLALDQALDPGGAVPKPGIAPLLLLTAQRLTVDAPEGLVPVDQRIYYGSDAAVTGGTFTSVGLLPGIGFTLASGPWFLSPVGLCGIVAQEQVYSGIARDKQLMRGNACDIRGALGYSGGGKTAFGLKGFKFVNTVTVETLDISVNSSDVELFASMKI